MEGPLRAPPGIYPRITDQGRIQIWDISEDDERHSCNFAEEYGFSFPVLLDQAGYRVSKAYALTIVPTQFLVSSLREPPKSLDCRAPWPQRAVECYGSS